MNTQDPSKIRNIAIIAHTTPLKLRGISPYIICALGGVI